MGMKVYFWHEGGEEEGCSFKSRAALFNINGTPSLMGYANWSAWQINSWALLSYCRRPLHNGQTKISNRCVFTNASFFSNSTLVRFINPHSHEVSLFMMIVMIEASTLTCVFTTQIRVSSRISGIS